MEQNDQEKNFQNEETSAQSINSEASKFGGGNNQTAEDSAPITYTVETQQNDENAEKYEKLSNSSLVLGIIGLCVQFFLNFLCCLGVPAIVLAIISISKALKAKKLALNQKLEGKALGGLILSIINLFIGAMIILVTVLMVLMVVIVGMSESELVYAY